MNIIKTVVHSIAVGYPTESLSRQVALWANQREDCGVELVFGRSALEIRRSLNGADRVLIDASDDHAQAIELFSQSIARLGSRRVAVYTERMHEGLELFVRTQGAWLLLGPLSNRQWEEFFASMPPPAHREPLRRQSSVRKAA
ncbi:MAG: hypothetical protein WCJ35_12095 [Planctomycetota bacterium]